MSSGVLAQTAPDEAGASAELLHEMFERQARLHPRQTAVFCAGQTLTYEELEQRANQLARFLHGGGVRPGERVGLLLPRSEEVYVALLGILKAGAAYVPLDPDYPTERVAFILSDCQARALVTTTELATKAVGFAGTLVLVDSMGGDIRGLTSEKLAPGEVKVSPEDLCYIIYTSGTTGRPKGVQIEHRSASHLVRAEGKLFRVEPADRVYQGFSIAFDASVEEVWLAFHAGATLVVGTREMVHAGPALSRLLTNAGVTVLSCVPTLLAMMEEDVPGLRLLILGGEACPPDLVKRWWRPGRRVVNTYGPTEATVIATWAECHPAKPVTIGRPLPTYSAWILDEELQVVTDSTPGELCLGGIGLARGYVGQPELTREKFIIFSPPGASPLRLYRTGDLARWTPDGEIEFLGRLDGQVKIRGFRVELSEIESVLMEHPQIKAAAVALREDVPGLQQLVAYAVPRGNAKLDVQAVRTALRARLPVYMVPALVETLSELPTLPSGKVDRKALPVPRSQPAPVAQPAQPPRTAGERQLLEVWTRLFAPQPVSIQDDFFLDLGGHSLLAARMVSELRKSPAFAQLSMLDVYRHPTITSLAAAFESGGADSAESNRVVQGIPFWRHFFCGAAQAVSLVFILSFFALQWLAPYLTYTVLIEEEYGYLQAILGALASLIVFYPFMVCVPILVKWIVIGRYKPGAYPLWGLYYFRWWLVTTVEGTVPVEYLAGTPLLNLYLRLMGARIGPNVHLAANSFCIYDLLSIGEDTSINVDSNLGGYTVEDGWLKLGGITIGKRCFVGARATMCENTTLEDDAALEDLSLLPRGETIPRGETWQGSPAQKSGNSHFDVLPGSSSFSSSSSAKAKTDRGRGGERERGRCEARQDENCWRPSLRRRFLYAVLHGLGVLTFPVLVVAALFPGIVVMNRLNYIDPYYWYLLLSPLAGTSFILFLCLEIAAVKWLLLGRVQPGSRRLHSFHYLRKWFVDQTMELSLDVLGPIYASVYLAPWYRLLGARLGKGAEVSTASFISPDLLSIGEESFIADSVSLGAPRVRDGRVTVGNNHIGKRSFIGNSAMLPPDTVIGDNVLIGCLSAPPADPAEALRENTSWLGSPAIFLPQRQQAVGFSEETTFRPSAKLRVLRAAIEFIRVILPSTGFIILLSLMFSALLLLHDHFSLGRTLFFFPVLYIGCGLAAVLFTVLAKWLLAGCYRPGEKPLWSTFVWRNELLNALHEHLAEPFLVGTLTGTPFVCWYFRLLGARIGRRVYMETTDLTEYDLVRIGDEVALNADCTIQTHLFEDRVMKMSTVQLAPRCSVGAGSLVLYDTCMEKGASLGSLSLLMKGEVLPAHTRWAGIPARPQKASEVQPVKPAALSGCSPEPEPVSGLG